MAETYFTNFSIWPIVKVFVLFGLFIYIVFGFVVVKQVKLMTDTLQAGLEGLVKTLSFVHFLFTIAVFIFALIIL